MLVLLFIFDELWVMSSNNEGEIAQALRKSPEKIPEDPGN